MNKAFSALLALVLCLTLCACGDGTDTTPSTLATEPPTNLTDHTHQFGDWTVTTAATCTEKGEESRTCACGETEKREVEATGHTWTGDGCTKPQTCAACGTAESVVPGHSYEDGICVRCGIPMPSEGLKFNPSEDGTAYYVAGIGTCTDADIVIPDTYSGLPVIGIADKAFYGCGSLTSIIIPDSVTSIGAGAFDGCTGLTGITIPDSVVNFGDEAFPWCEGLTYNQYGNAYYLGSNSNPYLILVKAISTDISNCTIHEQTKVISREAFYNCTKLTEIAIPDSVTLVGSMAFMGCDYVTKLTIGKGVTSMGSWAFAGCDRLTSVTIHNGATIIGNYAFLGCDKLKSITIPNSVTSIGEGTFNQCFNLSEVTLGSGISTIEDRVFSECSSLSRITIPNGVTRIGNRAFYGCAKLTKFVIPDGVTEVGYEAFYGCERLEQITIPVGVTYIGEDAFEMCPLTHVYYGGTIEQWNSDSKDKDWYSSRWYRYSTIHCTDGDISK